MENFDPGRKSYLLEIYRDTLINKIEVNGNPLNPIYEVSSLDKNKNGYYFNADQNTLLIKVSHAPELKIVIQ